MEKGGGEATALLGLGGLMRPDGRGHWQAGKRRNPVSGRARTLDRLRAYMAREGHSIRRMARLLHVHDRTLRRWLSGEDWPVAESVERMRQMLGKTGPLRRGE